MNVLNIVDLWPG